MADEEKTVDILDEELSPEAEELLREKLEGWKFQILNVTQKYSTHFMISKQNTGFRFLIDKSLIRRAHAKLATQYGMGSCNAY